MNNYDKHQSEDDAGQWASTPEGRAAILEALRQAEEANRKFAEAMRVTWQQLMEPMTI